MWPGRGVSPSHTDSAGWGLIEESVSECRGLTACRLAPLDGSTILVAGGLSRLVGSAPGSAPTGQPSDPAADRGPFGIMASLPTHISLILVPSRPPSHFTELVLRLITLHGQDSDDASGVTGLRLTFMRDHTILLDTIHGGRIILAGVSEHDWTTVISKELEVLGPSWRALTRPGELLVSTHNDSDLLLNLGDRRDRVRGRLLSAILRRGRLFHTTDKLNFVDLWNNSTNDSTRIEVEWSGDLPHSHVMDRITACTTTTLNRSRTVDAPGKHRTAEPPGQAWSAPARTQTPTPCTGSSSALRAG